MINIKGHTILADAMTIIETIRLQVFEQQDRDILGKAKETGDNIMFCCPAHGDGKERKPSCGMLAVDIGKKKAGTVHCFACGYTASLEEFVCTCFGYEGDEEFAINWLLSNFNSAELEEEEDIPLAPITTSSFKSMLSPKEVEKPTYVSEEELASYRFYHPYMYQRKLTNEVIERYDVGYQRDFRLRKENDDGTVWESSPIETITFPVRDKDGNCLFVSRRAIFTKAFYLPKNLDKPVYGVYELPPDAHTVVICESVINALTCVAYGMPAVALFGTGAAHQYQQLNALPCSAFKIGLDPDNAGEKGTQRLKKNIKGKMLSKLILPPKKDINDLTQDEFYNLKEEIIWN